MKYRNIKLLNNRYPVGTFKIDIHTYIEREGMATRPIGCTSSSRLIGKLRNMLSYNSFIKSMDIITDDYFYREIKNSYINIYQLFMEMFDVRHIEAELLDAPFYFKQGMYNNYRDFLILVKGMTLVSNISLDNSNMRFSKSIKNALSELIALFPYSKIRKLNLFLKCLAKISPTQYMYEVKVPHHYFKEFKKIKFCGKVVTIPKEYKFYLKDLYGSDWKIPDVKMVAADISNSIKRVR